MNKKRGPRYGYIEKLEKRLELMEKLLRPLRQAGAVTWDESLLDENVNEDDFLKTVQIVDPTRLRRSSSSTPNSTRQETSTPTPLPIHNHHEMPRASSFSPSPINSFVRAPSEEPLPMPEMADELIALYFRYIHPLMPMIHPPTFYRNFSANHIPHTLLYAMFSAAARFSKNPKLQSSPAFSAGDSFSERVRSVIWKNFNRLDIHTVQALTILGFNEYGCARGPTCWLYIGMAIRMSQLMGLNQLDSSDNAYENQWKDWVVIETKRRSWWACFNADRFSAVAGGRALAIDHRDCEIKLPSDDLDWENERPVITELLDVTELDVQDDSPKSDWNKRPKTSSPGHISYLIKLMAIAGRISQYVNRPKFRRPQEFLLLKKALETWRKSLPVYLTDPKNHSTGNPQYDAVNFAWFIHLVYHTSVILLFRSNWLDSETGRACLVTPLAVSSWGCCVAAAEEICNLARIMFQHPEVVNHSFSPFCLYTAATIHMEKLKFLTWEQLLSADNEISLIYNCLDRLQSWWGMAEKYMGMLKDLHTSLHSSATQYGVVPGQLNEEQEHDFKNLLYLPFSFNRLEVIKQLQEQIEHTTPNPDSQQLSLSVATEFPNNFVLDYNNYQQSHANMGIPIQLEQPDFVESYLFNQWLTTNNIEPQSMMSRTIKPQEMPLLSNVPFNQNEQTSQSQDPRSQPRRFYPQFGMNPPSSHPFDPSLPVEIQNTSWSAWSN